MGRAGRGDERGRRGEEEEVGVVCKGRAWGGEGGGDERERELGDYVMALEVTLWCCHGDVVYLQPIISELLKCSLRGTVKNTVHESQYMYNTGASG